MQQTITFPSGRVNYLFNACFKDWLRTNHGTQMVLVTDSNIAALHGGRFDSSIPTFVIPAGEKSKQLATIESLTNDLLKASADKNTLLVGVGGGVVTDIVGFLGATYMRGISFGFMPTSLLGMVDAAIGGKNGVDVGLYKNILGTIMQPEFILYDTSFLKTLPDEEWSNGFAEIIKYACIFAPAIFNELFARDIYYYKNDNEALVKLIKRCVAWKNKTVLEDEREKGIRKLLNFGHTFAHAIENMHALPHGQAVAIGMVAACKISEEVTGMDGKITIELKELLKKYNLPTQINTDIPKAMEILSMDKKRSDNTINYILLEQVGKAVIKPLPLSVIEKALARL